MILGNNQRRVGASRALAHGTLLLGLVALGGFVGTSESMASSPVACESPNCAACNGFECEGCTLPVLPTEWTLAERRRDGDKPGRVLEATRPNSRPTTVFTAAYTGDGERSPTKWLGKASASAPIYVDEGHNVDIEAGPFDLDGDGSPEWVVSVSSLGNACRFLGSHYVVSWRGGSFTVSRPFGHCSTLKFIEADARGPYVLLRPNGLEQERFRFEKGTFVNDHIVHPALVAARKSRVLAKLPDQRVQKSMNVLEMGDVSSVGQVELGGAAGAERYSCAVDYPNRYWVCSVYLPGTTPLDESTFLGTFRNEASVLPTVSNGYHDLYEPGWFDVLRFDGKHYVSVAPSP